MRLTYLMASEGPLSRALRPPDPEPSMPTFGPEPDQFD